MSHGRFYLPIGGDLHLGQAALRVRDGCASSSVAIRMRFALRCLLAATLGNAHDFDAVALARCQIALAEESAIRTIQLWNPAKGLLVAIEGRRHMDLVAWVSLQHLILRNQALRTLGEEDFVTKLDRRAHLAADDQVGMGFKDRKNLVAVGNLLIIEHTTTRLIDDTISQSAKVLDLLVEVFDGNVGPHVFAAHLTGLFA